MIVEPIPIAGITESVNYIKWFFEQFYAILEALPELI